MFKVMIVEDESIIAQTISDSLTQWQLEPIMVTDFEKVLDIFLEKKPDLVLMDINLPAFDGYYWNQEIRKTSQVPIIFISSRNSNMDQIMAMNMGADDFVEKPFSTDLLLAKIKALLRRAYNYSENPSEIIEHNGLILNLSNGSANVNDQEIDLSKNEFKLLQRLLKDKGSIVTRNQLLSFMWEDSRFVDDNTLTVNINRLRKKIEEAGIKDYIVTKVGQGYLIP
ncbi:response regulator transcription factor [Lactobacillus sp. YT155]|uniref:response regulator transcription factor n=1 Tax=Lactobacillus sp. YT155 TaxID=3060955 RepID=UPI00265EDF40|nr:response regulator transcription factor [Lactobacillus sp. YT155]MDO1605165.1 response regulator transcription factor [Lactobacillus sp. YT155]